jgi:hypothetical protein
MPADTLIECALNVWYDWNNPIEQNCARWASTPMTRNEVRRASFIAWIALLSMKYL